MKYKVPIFISMVLFLSSCENDPYKDLPTIYSRPEIMGSDNERELVLFLEISKLPELKDLKSFSQIENQLTEPEIENIQSIRVMGTPIESIRINRQFPKLKDIYVSNNKSLQQFILNSETSVNILTLITVPGLKNFKIEESQKNLSSLSIHDSFLESFPDLSNQKKLEVVSFTRTNMGILMDDFSNLKKCPQIHSLEVTGKLSALKEPLLHSKINSLTIYGGTSDPEINWLGDQKTITKLTIRDSGTKDFTFLRKMKQLVYIDIQGHRNWEEFPDLSQLENLVYLNLHGNGIKSLKNLKKLRKIKELDISDNRFSRLEGISESYSGILGLLHYDGRDVTEITEKDYKFFLETPVFTDLPLFEYGGSTHTKTLDAVKRGSLKVVKD